MKELTDIARRVREHSGLIYREDLKELQRLAVKASTENDELLMQLKEAEEKITELRQKVDSLQDELRNLTNNSTGEEKIESFIEVDGPTSESTDAETIPAP